MSSSSVPVVLTDEENQIEAPVATCAPGKRQRCIGEFPDFAPPFAESGECVHDVSQPIDVDDFEIQAEARRTPVRARRACYSWAQKQKILNALTFSTIQKVSEKYRIPERTLRGFQAKEEDIRRMAGTLVQKLSRKRQLTKHGELAEKLNKFIEHRRTRGAPITRKVCSDYMSEDEKYAELGPTTKQQLLTRLLKRFNKVDRRPTHVAQSLPQDNNEGIRKYHCLIRGALKTKKPESIVMLDETSVVWRPTNYKVIENRGAKTVTVLTKGNEKTSATALLAGHVNLYWESDSCPIVKKEAHFPPLLIVNGEPGKVLEDRWRPEAALNDVEFFPTTSGWITGPVFTDWCSRHLSKMPRPCWVFMDLHTTHVQAVPHLKAMGIQVFFIPAGCTSSLQTHDTHINAPFKASIKNAFTRHTSRRFREDDRRGEVGYSEIIRWVGQAMTACKPHLLSLGMKAHILTPASMRTTIILDGEESDSAADYEKHMKEQEAKAEAKKKAKEDAELAKIAAKEKKIAAKKAREAAKEAAKEKREKKALEKLLKENEKSNDRTLAKLAKMKKAKAGLATGKKKTLNTTTTTTQVVKVKKGTGVRVESKTTTKKKKRRASAESSSSSSSSSSTDSSSDSSSSSDSEESPPPTASATAEAAHDDLEDLEADEADPSPCDLSSSSDDEVAEEESM